MQEKKKIKVSEIENLSNAENVEFPKYTTQIINLINQNAQGTRPNVVGQLSDLIQEFDGKTLDEWITWYNKKMPDAVNNATERIFNSFNQMKNAFNLIDKDLIEKWVRDLLYTKTYCGLKFQSAIIAYIANLKGTTWRLATPDEEKKNIDGFIGDKPAQIKSLTYENKEKLLNEIIEVPIIYYEKKKDGITITYDLNML